jgi:hypothetical protein
MKEYELAEVIQCNGNVVFKALLTGLERGLALLTAYKSNVIT